MDHYEPLDPLGKIQHFNDELITMNYLVGYIFAPIILVFTIILAIALVAMVFMLKIKNISDDTSVAAIFIILAIISSIFLFMYLSKIKKGNKATMPDK